MFKDSFHSATTLGDHAHRKTIPQASGRIDLFDQCLSDVTSVMITFSCGTLIYKKPMVGYQSSMLQCARHEIKSRCVEQPMES
jgi:hypothetical protein